MTMHAGEPGPGYPLPWSVQAWLPATAIPGCDPHGFVLAKDGTEPIALTESHVAWIEWLP